MTRLRYIGDWLDSRAQPRQPEEPRADLQLVAAAIVGLFGPAADAAGVVDDFFGPGPASRTIARLLLLSLAVAVLAQTFVATDKSDLIKWGPAPLRYRHPQPIRHAAKILHAGVLVMLVGAVWPCVPRPWHQRIVGYACAATSGVPV